MRTEDTSTIHNALGLLYSLVRDSASERPNVSAERRMELMLSALAQASDALRRIESSTDNA